MARIRSNQSYARRRPVREPYDTVLIVCEGKKTEPNYFRGMRAAYRLSSANLSVTNADGTDPMSVVSHAEGLMADYDKTFCVFDRDTHPNFDQARQRVRNSAAGRAGKFFAVTSTPCFELWVLLHFRYTTAPILAARGVSAGDRAVDELKGFIPNYSKGMLDIFPTVEGRLAAALANGAKLENHNAGCGADNPETSVHFLVRYLQNLKA